MTALIRKVLHAFLTWRTKQKLYRACPEMREIDRSIQEAKRRHEKHSHYERAKQAMVLDMLKGAR